MEKKRKILRELLFGVVIVVCFSCWLKDIVFVEGYVRDFLVVVLFGFWFVLEYMYLVV